MSSLLRRGRMHKHILSLPPSKLYFLCFLWHSSLAFQMQLWNDFKWHFSVPLPTTTQHERKAEDWFSPRVTRCWITGKNAIFFQKASVFYICMPQASTTAWGANTAEASLTPHAFSSHQPKWPGPDKGAWGRPWSRNLFQFKAEREGRGKNELSDAGFCFLDRKSVV